MTQNAASTKDTDEIAQLRDGIADYIYARTGGAHISDTTIDCIIDECRAHATQRGLGMVDAARDLCRITSAHLREHNNDPGVALVTVDADVGVDGVALLVLIIAQKRARTRQEGTV
ncbi:MAG: hypothetical protein M0Z68_10695 [Gammaproteobacteria bacterium]|jgi:hypothetical protein|nr:hypothetical protein [Gammaproteobacteria bacterium]